MSANNFMPNSTNWDINVTSKMKVGTAWNQYIQENSELKQIFYKVDVNKDGIIAERELDVLRFLLFYIDADHDSKTDNNELSHTQNWDCEDYFQQSSLRHLKEITPYLKMREKCYEALLSQGENNEKIQAKFESFDNKLKEFTKQMVESDMIQENKERAIELNSFFVLNKDFSEILNSHNISIENIEQLKTQKLSSKELKLVDAFFRKTYRKFKSKEEYLQAINYLRSAYHMEVLASQILQTYNEKFTKKELTNFTPNGKIDEEFAQGNTGSCWVQAAINGLMNSPKGRNILSRTVAKLPNGDIKVTLLGGNETYIYSQDQIIKANKYSTGDLDIRAIEMAIDDHIGNKTLGGLFFGRTIDGGYSLDALCLLVDDHGHFQEYKSEDLTSDLKPAGWFEKFMNRINDPDRIACVAFNLDDENEIFDSTKVNPSQLVGKHEYTITRAGIDYVYLQNPWFPNAEFAVPTDKFKEIVKCITVMDLM